MRSTRHTRSQVLAPFILLGVWTVVASSLFLACNGLETRGLDLKLTNDGGARPANDGGARSAKDGSLDANLSPRTAAAATGSDAALGINQPSAKAPGVPCRDGVECGTGYCEDGVCCDRYCGGLCVSCIVQGSVGTCTPAEIGTDPRDQCPDEGASSCGRDGACDGVGACRNYPAGVICKAATCSGSTRTLVARCDGSGTCVAGTAQSCEPFTCDMTGGCRASCTADADCKAPGTCVAGTCGKKPLGARCSDASQCSSGFCENGACCATSCAGNCRSCALPGTEGSCALVPAGEDPLGQCADTGATSCGHDGVCNGFGACRNYAVGTVCAAATCSANTATSARRCTGPGVCGPGTTRPCGNFACGSGGTCANACGSSADCMPGFSCVQGACRKKNNGETCTAPADCASGFCQQGICCNRACTEGCYACNGMGTSGTCAPVPAGQDPLNQCESTAVATCGTDGSCNGQGACRLHGNGVVCAAATCAGSTQLLASRCNGAGACLRGTSQSCAPFACGTDGNCRTTCAANTDCSGSNTCAGNSCGKKSVGSKCSDPTECESGFCAQGVCCGSACTAKCQSCALDGNAGTCSDVPDGADPLNQCPDTGAGSCGTDGQCNGAGACRLYNAGVVCAPATCSAGSETPERTCDGAGACRTVTGKSCNGYSCGSDGLCLTRCATVVDCASGLSCLAGSCSGKGLGEPCGAATDCQSGICQQGVCCSSSCSGSCLSCALPGPAAGTCTKVPDGQDPLGQCADTGASSCGSDGFCDGNGACRPYPAGTVCAQASCTGSQEMGMSTCDGKGSCKAGPSKSCSPFVCGASACLTSCTDSSQCVNATTCKADTGTCTGTPSGAPNGGACTTASQCESGFCVSGHCCDSACSGICRSCALAGKEGTCTLISAGTDPMNHCDDAGAASCGTDGTCNGNGGCRMYAAGTVCGAGSCANGMAVSAPICNGNGSCEPGQSTACAPYTCGDKVCLNSCTGSDQCASPNACSVEGGNVKGICGSSKKPQGAVCASDSECDTNVCAQGRCCGSKCTGNKKSCSMPGHEGTCTNK